MRRSAELLREAPDDGSDNVTISEQANPFQLSPLKRGVFISLAGFFFLLGAAGVILPGLPTTPFLLLTSYFLLRAWPSMNRRLLNSRLFGGVLRDWQHHGGVQRHIKIKAIVLVGLMVCAAMFFSEMSTVVRGVIASGALIGLLVIRRLPEVLPR